MDGNKCIGDHTMLVFLALNGVELDYTQKKLTDTFVNLATGKIRFEELLLWIIAHKR